MLDCGVSCYFLNLGFLEEWNGGFLRCDEIYYGINFDFEGNLREVIVYFFDWS